MFLPNTQKRGNMSYENYSIDILHFQDKTLEIKDVSKESICGIQTTIIEVAKPKDCSSCIHCGSIDIIIKDYYYRTIKYLDIAGHNCLIKYKQRRYFCKSCNKTFNEPSNLVDKNSIISNAVKIKSLEECRVKQSFKDVGQRLHISTTTVINTFSDHITSSRKRLTEIICFDEFKASTLEGTYAFILADPLSGDILDILPSRKQDYLYDYFNKVPDTERYSVKYVVTDLFESYRTIVKNLFWKSIHIADRFHWIRLATEALNNLRIRVMNNYKKLGEDAFKGKYNKYSTYYYMLKKYAKLLEINRYNREQSYFERVSTVYYLSKKEMTVDDIIEYLVNNDGDLEEGYNLLQDLYKISKLSTYETARNNILDWIEKVKNSSYQIKEFNSVILTYKSWIKEITNSFIINPKTNKRMTNGFIEGKNNYCKVIKRIGFGYKDFDTFRAKILYSNAKENIPYKY